jgi:hypothetical protein
MKKTRDVKNDVQVLGTIKKCLVDMRKSGEIRDSTETSTVKPSGNPFADLRQLLNNSGLMMQGRTDKIDKEHQE